ncbi:MAG: DNA-processing protein DprA [Bacilli bacterium]|jgi:DNA processing protein|nr:DNA-processing protein DprA [Bacilli bacterium]HOF53719.1 DNA-processing protein DprA [Bacilli bacterium]HPK67852.1 DNA-processing protein DprA [Bacilli bacterium]
MTGRDILIYLAIKYKGNWDDIYGAIKRKEPIDDASFNDLLATLKANAITIIDKNYPDHLKQTHKPPFVLFYYGDLSLIEHPQETVAFIGSRKASDYGKKMTRIIVTDLAKKMIIVSGMAKGIDAVAHETAINVKGKTIAVLGSGIDYCYPRENLELYKIMKENHLVISEYPNRVEPDHSQFPLRNRIIAMLAKSVVVGEADLKSGTLITVSYALSQGRDVCCVPYPADASSACNSLIKQGAKLVENANDVYEEMGIEVSSQELRDVQKYN